MQKAVENFIDIQSKLGRAFSDIGKDINNVRISAIKKAREKATNKQRIEWRKLSK